jgi:hypothetical protein
MQNTVELLRFITWPAILKLNGEDELIYIADAEQFIDDNAIRQTHFIEQDILIDSKGNAYHITSHNSLTLTALPEQLSLEHIEALFQRHLSNHGNCCVAKFHANSISEAINCVFG